MGRTRSTPGGGSGSIRYDIGFNVDKTQLNQLKSSLQELQGLTKQDFLKINPDSAKKSVKEVNNEIHEIKRSAQLVEHALNKAFNANLGTLNVVKFNQELNKTGLKINDIYQRWSKLGIAGQNAFRDMSAAILTANSGLKKADTLLDNMAKTMGNTVKWGVASSVMNTFTNNVQQAYGYVKNLDRSLNDIRIVTGYSADEMDRFAEKANKAAKALGQSTTNYTDAALIYYQQGLSDTEVAARAETTLKAANVTGQSGEEVSEQLTAVWNGYKVSAEESELYIDKLAAVAASTASDLEELSTGMSKVASAASIMGVDIDQLNAMLATTVSVTRQAPESVGTAYKTIFARIGDIEAGIDTETSLDMITQQIKDISDISVLDVNHELRDIGDIIEEVGGKWKTMNREQQVSLAQAMAGTRQYNNLLSLFDNWDMYEDALNTSANAAGTLQEQQDIYMESTKAHLNQLRAASEDLYDSLLDEDSVIGVADALTFVVDQMANFVDAVGGGSDTLLMLGSIGAKVFSQQIATGLTKTINNFQLANKNAEQLKSKMAFIKELQEGEDTRNNPQVQALANMSENIYNQASYMSEEDVERASGYIDNANKAMRDQMNWQAEIDAADQYLHKLDDVFDKSDSIKNLDKDRNSVINEKLSSIISDQGMTENTKKAATPIAKLRDEYSKLDEKTKRTGQANKQLEKAFQSTVRATNQMVEEGNELLQVLNKETQEYKELKNAIDAYNYARREGENSTSAKDKDITDEAGEVLRRVEEANKKAAENTKNTFNIEQDEERSSGLEEKVDEAAQKGSQFSKEFDLTKNIEQVVQFASGLGQVASGLSILSNLSDIIKNEDLSAGEKAIQVVESLSMGFIMLASGVSTMIQSAPALQASFINLAISVSGLYGPVQGVGGAFKVLGTTIWTSLAPVLPIILAITAALGAAWLITYKATKAKEEDANATKTANDQLERLTSTYERLNSEAEHFRDTVSDYNEIVDTFKSMDKSAEEYAETLQDANDKAKELIETYGLFDDYYIDENGLIVLDQDALEQGIADKEKAAAQAEQNKNVGQINANQAALRNEKTNVKRTTAYEIGKNRSGESVYSQYTDEQLNLILNTIKDFEAGKAGEGVTEDQYFKNILGDQFSTEAFEGLFDASGAVRDEFYQLAEATQGLEDSNSHYMEQILAGEFATGEIDKKIKELATGSDGEVDEGKYDQLAAAIAAGSLTPEQKEQYNKEVSNVKEDISGINNKPELSAFIDGLENFTQEEKETLKLQEDSNEELAKTYATLLDSSLDRESLTVTEEKGAYTVTDAQGIEVVSEMDRDALAYSSAQLLAVEDINRKYAGIGKESAEELTNAIEGMMGSAQLAGAEYGADFSNAMLAAMTTGKLADGEALDFSSIIGDIDPSEIDELKEMDSEDILALLGLNNENVKNAILSVLGISEDELINAFKQGAEDYNEEDYQASVDSKAEQIATEENLDVEELKYTRDHIQASADEIDGLSKSLEKNGELAQEVAKDILKYSEAAEDAAENMKDWFKNINSKDLKAQGDGIDKFRKSLEKIYDMDLSDIDEDILKSKEAQELFNTAINGTGEEADAAYFKLQAIVMMGDNFKNYTPTIETLENGFKEIANINVSDSIGEIQTNLEELAAYEGVDIGDKIKMDGSEISQKIQAGFNDAYFAALAGGEDVETAIQMANAAMSELGYGMPEVSTKKISGTGELPKGWKPQPDGTVKTVNADGQEVTLAGARIEETGGGTYKWEMSVPSFDNVGSVTRTSGGGGGRSYSPKPSKSSGSGGGGGGSKTKLNKVTKTKKDPFRNVNNRLTKINNQFSKLEKEQERLFGKDLTKNLQQQTALLERQLEVLKEKRKIALDEKKDLKQDLKLSGKRKKRAKNNNIETVTYDSDGNINNYYEVINSYEDSINKYTKQYNKMSAKKQKSKKGKNLKKLIEQLQADKEYVQNKMDDYDDINLNVLAEIDEAELEAQIALVEKRLESVEVTLNIKTHLEESRDAWDEFIRHINDTDLDPLASAKADLKKLYRYTDENSDSKVEFKNSEDKVEETISAKDFSEGLVNTQTKRLNETIAAIKAMEAGGTSSLYTVNGVNNFKKAYEDLDRYKEDLMASLTTVKDLANSIRDSYAEAMDDMIEAYEKQTELLQSQESILEHAKELTELIHGDNSINSRKLLDNIYDSQKANLAQQLAASKAAATNYKELMEKETDPELKLQLEEQYRAELERTNELTIRSAELLKEEYSNAIAIIFDDWETEIFGANKNLDYVQQEWELKNANAEMYLDTINSTYEIEKLQRKYQKSIDENKGVKAQRELNKLMDEEMKKLREKDKLTKYDVDRANALYELKLKEIALEEAQQNKSQMRLRRDSSGNYSYQFVADQNAIADAQQEVDDAKNSLYNMDRDEFKNNQQAILDAYAEYQEKMKNAANLSAEERALIEQEYQEKITGLVQENSVIRNNLLSSTASSLGFDQTSMNLEQLNEQMSTYIPNWTGSVQTLINQFSSEGVGAIFKNLSTQINTAQADFVKGLNDLGIDPKVTDSWTGFSTVLNDSYLALSGFNSAQNDVIANAKNEVAAIGSIKAAVDALVLSLQQASSESMKALTTAQQLSEQHDKNEASASEKAAATTTTTARDSTTTTTTSEKKDINKDTINRIAAIIKFGSEHGHWGDSKAERKKRLKEKFIDEDVEAIFKVLETLNKDSLYEKNKSHKYKNLKEKYKTKYKYSTAYRYEKFDTGGYTGTWNGNAGRIALLHQKELVLNSKDTENFLSGINILRNMESFLNSMNVSMASKISNLTSSLNTLDIKQNEVEKELKQNVQIEANFPSVNDSKEIEEAFNNLINKASQYIHSVRR